MIQSPFKAETFRVGDLTLPYLYPGRVETDRSERVVELALGRYWLQMCATESVLEVGNVMRQYVDAHHLVVDKYEQPPYPTPKLLNVDIVDYLPSTRFDLVLSISTLEHIGRDVGEATGDDAVDHAKALTALERMKELTTPGGKVVVCWGMGQHIPLDQAVATGDYFMENRFLLRVDEKNHWEECAPEVALRSVYNNPFPAANAVFYGVWEKP